MFKTAPLSSSFTVMSMLLFMFAIVYTSFGRINVTWGFTIGLFAAVMFVASMISLTRTPVNTLLINEGKEPVRRFKSK